MKMLRLKHMALGLVAVWGLLLLCQRRGCPGVPPLLTLPHQRAKEQAGGAAIRGGASAAAAAVAAAGGREAAAARWQTGPARWMWHDGNSGGGAAGDAAEGTAAAAVAAAAATTAAAAALPPPPPLFNVSRSLVPFPRIIHMTWKTHSLPSWSQHNYRSWERHNPGWTIRVWDDAQVDAFVTQHLPAILPWWRTALKPVQRADVFRYLVLREQGGVYTDIDVTCMQPVEAWFARERAYFSAGFVAGFEEVTARPDWRQWFATQFQVVQWTMGSVAGHPILRRVLRNIVAWYREGRHKANKSVIKSTGPGIWSVAIAQHLREAYGIEFGRAPFGHAAMKARGVHAGDVLLLPKPAFATQGGTCADGQCMVRHNFRGTWKKGYVPAPDDKSGSFAVPHKKVAVAVAVTRAPGVAGVHHECDGDQKKLCGDVKPGNHRTHACLLQMLGAGKLSAPCAAATRRESRH